MISKKGKERNREKKETSVTCPKSEELKSVYEHEGASVMRNLVVCWRRDTSAVNRYQSREPSLITLCEEKLLDNI